MNPMDDWQLLREYAQKDSDEAFRTLVERYAGLVYHAGLQTMDYYVSVTRELANGGRELELPFARQQLDFREGSSLITHFDSRNASGGNTADPLIPMLRKLSDVRIRYITDAAGIVEKTEGTEELVQEAARTIKQQQYQEIFKRLFQRRRS